MDTKELANIILDYDELELLKKFEKNIPSFGSPEARQLAEINKKLNIDKDQLEDLIYKIKNDISDLEDDVEEARRDLRSLEKELERKEITLKKMKDMLDDFNP